MVKRDPLITHNTYLAIGPYCSMVGPGLIVNRLTIEQPLSDYEIIFQLWEKRRLSVG